MVSCGKPFAECCPFKCHESYSHADMDARTEDLLSMASQPESTAHSVDLAKEYEETNNKENEVTNIDVDENAITH